MPDLPRLVDVDTRRGRYGGPMTKRTWTLLMWVGVAVVVAGVIAAAVGFSMDTTYPEEVPGWSITVVWVGVLIAAGSGIARAVTKS
jgi:hypothetical protein